jgi:ArsR family transcriptional regulator
MKTRDESIPDDAVTLLKSMADPNRLRILNVLLQGDSCNCELKKKLGMPANLLSHHLRILREAGLVHTRRDAIDGRWIYYSVDRGAVTRWQHWFSQFLDPGRIQERPVLCGPEGQVTIVEPHLEISR